MRRCALWVDLAGGLTAIFWMVRRYRTHHVEDACLWNHGEHKGVSEVPGGRSTRAQDVGKRSVSGAEVIGQKMHL